MSQVMSELFEREPEQWGLRGDPWVWAAMRTRLASTCVPPGTGAVQRLLLDTFAEVVGVDLSVDPLPDELQLVHRDEPTRRGESSGFVDALRWQRRLIPLLVSRAGTCKGRGGPRADDGADGESAPADPIREQHVGVFEDAWRELAAQCHDTVAPAATYQAWLAHFTMDHLTPLHVLRDVDFDARHLLPGAARHLRPVGNFKVDMLTLRRPIVRVPRGAFLGAHDLPDGPGNPRSGLARLADFSVISELRVTGTQMSRLGYAEVVGDFQKLSVILDAAEVAYPDQPLPAAYVGIFVNVTKPVFSFDLLRRRLREAHVRPDLQLAAFDLPTGEVSFDPVG